MDSKSSVGPFGGKGGCSWDDGTHTTIRKILVVHGSVIDSIHIEYDDNGQSVRHGGPGGSYTKEVKLDFPDEYLTSVSGYYVYINFGALVVVKSLTFQSNRKTYGPFGTEEGNHFSFPSFNGKIVGFHGRSGSYLDSIGAHVQPITDPNANESVGPYGGQHGSLWDDSVYTTVRQLIIAAGALIYSICIEYDKNGQSVWSSKHGESNAGLKHTVKLDYPEEFLISVSGYYTENSNFSIVHSLTIQSNKRTYGPFGTERGNYFFMPSFGGKIIGFHGSSGNYLDAIGAHVKRDISYPSNNVGPFGGQGGEPWDDGVYSTIRQIMLWSGSVIDSIHIEYDKDGQSVWSPKHGTSVGGGSHTVKLDYPNEFLIAISGYYGIYSGMTVIRSLTFQSNKKTHGPFGPEEGNYFFSVPSTGRKIIGFHGRSGPFLDSIGTYIEPNFVPYPYESVGPYGGQGGNPWDDLVYTTVRQLQIYAGKLIHSICIEYDKNGQSVWSSKHGESNVGLKHTVKLDYPCEFLVSVSGYYSTDCNSSTIQSLTIQSNKQAFGPFGTESGNYFSLSLSSKIIGFHGRGKIIGFHGRSGDYLDAIGAYVVPIAHILPAHDVKKPFGA